MARYEHLKLLRLPERFERRKNRGAGGAPQRDDPSAHSGRLRSELALAVADQQRRRPPEFVDPSLILRVRMNGMTLEEDWKKLGLTLLSSDENKTLILFASTDDLRAFEARLDAYSRGTLLGQKAPSYSGFVGRIDEIGAVQPADRIGIRFREEGFATPDDIPNERTFVVDVELWDVGQQEVRQRRLEEMERYIQAHGGDVLDRYIGPSITMLRARLNGAAVRTLLAIEVIASVDLPPEPDVATRDAFDMALADLPELVPVPDDAPVIGVIDSGVNEHPLLEGALVGAIGVPASLGVADEWGHGTRVGGVAVFGDLRQQLANGNLIRRPHRLGQGRQRAREVTEYPRYLLEPRYRLYEPAPAMNAITVGSVAHGEGLGPEAAEYLMYRPITRSLEPSPFTRMGPASVAR